MTASASDHDGIVLGSLWKRGRDRAREIEQQTRGASRERVSIKNIT